MARYRSQLSTLRGLLETKKKKNPETNLFILLWNETSTNVFVIVCIFQVSGTQHLMRTAWFQQNLSWKVGLVY